MEAISKGYTNILQTQSGNEEGEEQDNEPSSFATKWGWVAWVDSIAKTSGSSWNEVWQMGIVEFLNMIAYIKDKAEYDKEQAEKWKNKN